MSIYALLISTMTFLDVNISIKDIHDMYFTLYNLQYQTWLVDKKFNALLAYNLGKHLANLNFTFIF